MTRREPIETPPRSNARLAEALGRASTIAFVIAAALALAWVLATTGCGLGEEGPAPAGTTTPARIPAQCRGEPVQVQVKPLSPYVYQQGDGTAYFDVWVEGCPMVGAARPALDIALVIDTSGSMAGEKLARAQAAAEYLLASLGPQDRLALVSYNTSVTLMFPLTAVTPGNRGWMAGRIRRLYATDMTNLGGGLQVGVQQVLAGGERNAVQRVILISDGLANVGVVQPAALHGMAASARQRQISVTTMGVGLQFNEILLQNLAEYGGGRYHYIRDAHALVPIFQQEIVSAQAAVATSLEITVAGCQGCEVLESPGYALQKQGGVTRIVVSDLAGGERRKALVKVRLPRDRPGRQVLDVKLAYRPTRGTAAGKRQERARQVAFELTGDARRVAASVDRRVADRVTQVQVSQQVQKAMRHYEFGDTSVSGNLLSGAAGRLEAHYRATGSKRSLRRAQALRAAERRVRAGGGAPASAPAGQDMLKRMRYKAAAESRQ